MEENVSFSSLNLSFAFLEKSKLLWWWIGSWVVASSVSTLDCRTLRIQPSSYPSESAAGQEHTFRLFSKGSKTPAQ